MPKSSSVLSVPGMSFGLRRSPGRAFYSGMGEAVARRTILRPGEADFGDVADRVSAGNVALPGFGVSLDERVYLRNAIACGALLTAGRHLQHGDLSQPERNIEVYSNCSTASMSWALFYLLLNGSGVGRSYDDGMMAVDWAAAPPILLYLSPDHPDSHVSNRDLFVREMATTADELPLFLAREWLRTIAAAPVGATIVRVEDSREGWAAAVETLEAMAFRRESRSPLIFDLSDVRPLGAPIAGMQGRPASGPLSLARAFMSIRRDVVGPARAGGMPRWEQAMRVDHALSVEVQVGGARRAARMSTKSWRDPDIMRFVGIKERCGLWTSNNSVMVDAEFWQAVRDGDERAAVLFDEATRCMYVNGEPGFLNGDKLEDFVTGSGRDRPVDNDGTSIGSRRYKVGAARTLVADMSVRNRNNYFHTTVNPCAEVPLSLLGGYCVLSDIAPIFACPVPLESASHDSLKVHDGILWDMRVEDATRLAARFLVRVNTMDAMYAAETRRTNRIGIGLTGLHEWAWVRFGLGFRDLLDEGRSELFWRLVTRLSAAAKDEANAYSATHGLARPTTITVTKPSGSVSKLFGLTEGVHLPARRHYLRWVQFKGAKDDRGDWLPSSDPLLADYERRGYPLRALKSFPGMTVVGFPTEPLAVRLGMGDRLVMASEATPEEQYQWLRLIEKYWIGERQGGQVSYTLKVRTDLHDLESFRDVVLRNQPTIRCCAVLPTRPDSELGYEYLPEEEISREAYEAIVARISGKAPLEDIDMERLRCESGVCPL